MTQSQAMDVRFTRSARKHRVGKARVVAAMEDSGEPQRIPASEPGESDRLLWIGRDAAGVLIEVIAVERPDALLVIHAMPLHYRDRRR
ncbi:MAG: hypothetical protein AMXMBFR23_24820 [Chloroflexota bacterium]